MGGGKKWKGTARRRRAHLLDGAEKVRRCAREAGSSTICQRGRAASSVKLKQLNHRFRAHARFLLAASPSVLSCSCLVAISGLKPDNTQKNVFGVAGCNEFNTTLDYHIYSSYIWPLQRCLVPCDHSLSASQSQSTDSTHPTGPHSSCCPGLPHATVTHSHFTLTTHNSTSPLCRAATHRRKAPLLRPTSLNP